MKVVAIVPIKHHSSRVPRKNFRLLNGVPLYRYILDTLSNCESVTQIVVDTDSLIIKEGVNYFFPNIIVYDRPESLKGDDVSTNVLLTNVVNDLQLYADIYLHTHTTNPILSVNTIEMAIKTFLQNDDLYDSLFTVNRWHTRLYNKDSLPVNHNPENLVPTQTLDPLYEENSCLYVVPATTLEKHGRRIGNNPYLFEMNKTESIDIDWEDDFKVAEAIVKYYGQNSKNKVVVITGSSGGIGAGLCWRFAQEGYRVLGVDIKEPDFEQTMYIDRYIQVDLTKDDAPSIILNAVNEFYDGHVDCLINNAAIQVNKTVNETTLDDWEIVSRCNLRATLFLSQVLFPSLEKCHGSIINISSVHATNTTSGIAAYATTKGGLTALTRATALEYAPHGVRVNCILPGAIDTPMLRDGLCRHGESIETLAKKHPIKRVGIVDDIAIFACFLSNNDKAGFFVGSCVTIDGGVTAKLSSE